MKMLTKNATELLKRTCAEDWACPREKLEMLAESVPALIETIEEQRRRIRRLLDTAEIGTDTENFSDAIQLLEECLK